MKKFGGIEKKASLLRSIVVTLVLLFVFVPLSVQADDPTLVYISPASKTVSANQTFSLEVACTPGQPIKAYEFKIVFNPLLLQANLVTEGTIFTGYSTFFNPGTINNTAGTIVDIYGLILGTGTVTGPGSFVSISFTARAASGTSSIGLIDVGVANASTYVPITVTNGSVTLRQFTLGVTYDGSGTVSKNPNQATYPYGVVVQLTATASAGWVFQSWSGDLSGSTNPASITITGNKSVTAHFTQNQYTLSVSTVGSGSVTKNPNKASYAYGEQVTLTAVASSGWMFNQWTGDLSGTVNPQTITMNGNKAVNAHFIDSSPPQFSTISYVTSNPLDTDPLFGWVNVSCTVTDNVAVSVVVLRIRNPSGSWNNVTMQNRGAGQYYYRSSTAFSTPGNYSYHIWAQDTTGNTNTSGVALFSMPANWDINMDGSCTIFDLVLISNHYSQTGGNGWIREDVDNNGKIELLDLVFASNHFGASWW